MTLDGATIIQGMTLLVLAGIGKVVWAAGAAIVKATINLTALQVEFKAHAEADQKFQDRMVKHLGWDDAS